ncbi:MAG TPA: S1C family serine protease, partial [Casimicrobiaceae bacterium]|nr:S1C family serine protease [Casimicrobiaceae bacterium]
SIWLTANDGAVVAAHALAYDAVTGFGLVQPLGRLRVPALARGSSAAAAVGDNVITIGHGGRAHALKAHLIAKREFAGYWEYVLDEALFASPPHPQWGGAALVGADGKLLGIGSLLVQEAQEGEQIQGNMFVPIDLLGPIYDEMLKHGARASPPRPWLGMYTAEAEQRLVVSGIARGGPAENAGVRLGDIVVEVAGERVSGLADMFRKVWSRGAAGIDVPLTIARDSELTQINLRSADRGDFLKKPQLQ